MRAPVAALLGAEVRRSRGSAAAQVPVFALLAGGLQGVLFLLSPDALRTWAGVTAWHNLWVVFLGPLALALLAALTARREARARGGGTWWRAIPPQRQHLATFAVMAGLALAMHLTALLVCLPFGLAAHLPGPPPLGRLLTAALALWACSLPLLALLDGLARRAGLPLTLAAAFVLAISGTVMAEGPRWLFNPAAWGVRATLPLIGTHANGIPLEAGSAWWALPLWPLVTLALVATPLLVTWAGRTLPGQRPARRSREAGRGRVDAGRAARPSALGAEFVKWRGSPLPLLALGGPLLAALLAAWRHAALGALEGWTLLVVPFGAALVAVQTWAWEEGAWRALRGRGIPPLRLQAAKGTLGWLLAFASTLLLALACRALGVPAAPIARLLVLNGALLACLLALHLWLAVRFGGGPSMGVGVIGTLLAALLGGTGLGERLWPLVPWTWGWVAAGRGEWLGYALLAAVLAAVFMALGVRASARSSGGSAG